MRSLRAPSWIIGIWAAGTLLWWGLAFFPTGSPSPEWLNVARDVCFGSPEGGLPNAAGWMVLILGPLSFLLVGIFVWSTELHETLVTHWKTAPGKAAMVIVVAIFGIEATWVVEKVYLVSRIENFDFENKTTEDLPEAYPRTNVAAADFALIDQFGARVKLSDFKERNVILTFAFAHCASVCPLLVKQTLEAADAAQGSKPQVLLVTLDPWRDTPKSLPFLAKKWQLPENARVLSGSVKEVTSVLEAFKVPFQRNQNSGDVVHPALVYLIAPGGNIAYTFNNVPVRWLTQALERMSGNGRYTTTAR